MLRITLRLVIGLLCTECLVADYVLFNGVFYNEVAEEKTYDEARETCARDGGLLAMPKDSAINTFIHDLAGGGNRWIGLNDRRNEGQFEFEDGQTLASTGYNDWLPGEPNDQYGEDCAVILAAGNGWNDAPCSILMGFISVVYGDPCTDYEAVDEPTRSTGSLIAGTVRCDSGLRTQWYRFVSPAGGEIPTDCSLLGTTSCSTLGPVWMKGTLPTPTEGEVVRQACRIGFGECEGNCWDISVKSCARDGESYYVYLLPPTPGCPEAYCAGTEVPCPPGQSSENYGFTPGCTADFPSINTNPQLTNSSVGDPSEVVMLCDFDRPPWDNLTMEVDWVAGSEIFHQTSLTNGERRAVLGQNELRLGMGKTILTEVVEVEENGDEKYIQLQPTLPLLCTVPESTFPCTVSVQVEFRDVDYSADRQCQGHTVPDAQSSQNCVRDFTKDDWNGILEFPVKATRDLQIDGRSDGLRYLKVGFRPMSSVIAPLWDGYQVEDVDVQTRLKMCNRGNVACNCGVSVRSGNEVFILNKCSGSRDTFQWYTGGVIRRDLPLAMRVDHHGAVGDDTRFYVADGGEIYLVYFPTGSWMKITFVGGLRQAMNVYIYPSTDDFNDKTVGLCGTFDGDKENDGLRSDMSTTDTIRDGAVISHTAFVNSWKIPEGQTLVEGVLPPAPLPMDERLYCTCNDDPVLGSTVICDSTLAYNCRWEDEKRRAGVRPVADQQNARKRRSTSYNDEVYDDDMFAFDFDDSLPTVPPPSWPAPNGMTEAEARAYCEDALLNSPAGAVCSSAMEGSADIEGAVDGCVADIQATGDTSWADVAVTTMEESCSDILYKNTSFWTKNNNETNNGTTNGTLAAPSFFFDTVSCPGNCSQQGVCEKGKCVCEKGFEGPSCSIETDKPPDAFFIPKGGLCDINTRPCERTPVIGQNFMESENLTCSLQSATVDENGVQVVDGNITVEAEFENFARVVCPLPRSRVRRSAAAGHRTTAEATLVSISNDGVRFSPPVLLITYDAVCQDCNVTGFCVLRNNTCQIDGRCYSSGDTQIGNWCKQCLPSVNVSAWSDRQDNPGGNECVNCPPGITGDGKNCTEDTGVTDQQGSSWYEQPAYIALLSVGAVAVAAALIGVAVWRVKAHNATRGKVGDLPLEERKKSAGPEDLHVKEMSDQDGEYD
ncbi:VWDE [Branchiostoma lanceolatum]|uniref:VWDE protein n=1 Tax=Branchiostoma lanceolatum TaxID=7740 RepID=A0A8J9ZPA2_BRALA|nr:VWDE [Branchiostoma lanceolatum]